MGPDGRIITSIDDMEDNDKDHELIVYIQIHTTTHYFHGIVITNQQHDVITNQYKEVIYKYNDEKFTIMQKV